jgi:hypothetical protein
MGQRETKTKATIMLSTTGQITQEKNAPYNNRLRLPQGVPKGRPKSQTPRDKGEQVLQMWKGLGHYKRECQLKKEEKVILLMTFDEE